MTAGNIFPWITLVGRIESYLYDTKKLWKEKFQVQMYIHFTLDVEI